MKNSKKDIKIVVDRIKLIIGEVREKLSDSIEVTFKEGENRIVLINADTNEQKEFNKFYECCGVRYEEPEPRFFSFNMSEIFFLHRVLTSATP